MNEKWISDRENYLYDDEKLMSDGENCLSDGEKRLSDGEKRLSDGEKRLSDGEKWMYDDEKWLSDGEKWMSDDEKRLSVLTTPDSLSTRQYNFYDQTGSMCMRVMANDMCNEVNSDNVEYFDYSPFGEVLKQDGEDKKPGKVGFISFFQTQTLSGRQR